VLASNATIDFIRRKRFEENLLHSGPEPEALPQEKADTLPEEDKHLLDEAIKRLNKKEKAYLESSYTAGRKYKEIAEIFNVPINSVSTVIARAKKKIKRYIESQK